MKKAFFILMSAAFSLAACKSSDPWELVWEENFDGPAIDTTVWTRIAKGGNSGWAQNMSLREDLAYIEDGELVLMGKVNDGSGPDTTKFVTGGFRSRGKKSFYLGKVEIRAKFSCADGFWPALWLMPDAELPEPVYAEVDILEHYDADSLSRQTVHSYYTLHVDKDNPPHTANGIIDPNAWNVYSTEIYKDSLCLFTNGVKTLTYPRVEGLEHQFPWPDYPFYVILSNQLGGTPKRPVRHPEQLPSELRVDWVRVYRQKNK